MVSSFDGHILIRSVATVYADWCGPCKQIAPLYEQLSAQLSRPNKVTFTKVDTEKQAELAQTYKVTALPTFMIFKNQATVESIQGANPRKLSEAIKKLAAEADSDSANGFGSAPSSGSSSWIAGSLPKGYGDVTDQVDVRGLDLLNADSQYGGARILFDRSKPSSLDTGKGKNPSKAEEEGRDWVESDTDEQLMLYIPLMSTLKIHTLYITSLPPKQTEDEMLMRPKTIQIYSNRAHVLGFDEAEDVQATQAVNLEPRDWDEKTGTAKIELRFVKFQSVKSLVIFVVDGEAAEDAGDKVRIDRLRIVGERGEKRDLGKLEKAGDHEH